MNWIIIERSGKVLYLATKFYRPDGRESTLIEIIKNLAVGNVLCAALPNRQLRDLL